MRGSPLTPARAKLRARLVLVDEQPMAVGALRLTNGTVLVEHDLPLLEVFHWVTDSDDGGQREPPIDARVNLLREESNLEPSRCQARATTNT